MPVLKRFENFVIRLYFADHNPPHVHVVGADFEALVAIADGAILEGSMPAKAAERALSWIAENRNELVKKWSEFQ